MQVTNVGNELIDEVTGGGGFEAGGFEFEALVGELFLEGDEVDVGGCGWGLGRGGFEFLDAEGEAHAGDVGGCDGDLESVGGADGGLGVGLFFDVVFVFGELHPGAEAGAVVEFEGVALGGGGLRSAGRTR